MVGSEAHDLQRPVVWITGSGSPRLGQHLARRWAHRRVQLVLHARRSLAGAEALAAELAHHGPLPLVLDGDLGDGQTVAELVQQIVGRFGRIDVLIHTASSWGRQDLARIDAAHWLDQLRTNLGAPFWLCQQVGLAMVQQPSGGSIVLCGDWSTQRPYLDHAAYLVAKGSLPTLVDVFAVELQSRNPRVRVNAVLPGPIALPNDRPAPERPVPPDHNLLGRAVHPDEVASAIELLCDVQACSGTCLPVTGGRHLQA
jgi:pteridine reductase